MWPCFTVAFLLLFSSIGNAVEVEEGDICTTEGTAGRCTYFKDCPKAREDIENHKQPQNCGFIGSDVLVCCPVQQFEKHDVVRIPGLTAKEKCKEYAKYVFSNRTIPHPLIGRKPIFVSRPECGFRHAPLVSGGTEAKPKEFPHMAAIGYNASEGLRYLCGGSLISELYILTAAHCLSHTEFNFKVYQGFNAYFNAKFRRRCRRRKVTYAFLVPKNNEADIGFLRTFSQNLKCLGYQWPGSSADINVGKLLKITMAMANCNGKATEVKLGATRLSGKHSGTNYGIAEHIYHPEYKFKFYHDIGLLKLAEPAKLFFRARPACLFTSFEIPTNRSLISGWGRAYYGGPLADELMKVTVDIFDNDRCNQAFKSEISRPRSKLEQGVLPDDHICAGSPEAKDACQGDSGGPLQIYHEPDDGAECMYDIIGVVSFGNPCGEDNTSGVYTRVSNYIRWIENTVWPEVYGI